jgi:hypothetical protein
MISFEINNFGSMKSALYILSSFIAFFSFSQKPQSPSEFLGYKIGANFTRHHQVVAYFNQLAENASDRIQVVQYGSTNENRELLASYISTPENIQRLEKIKADHAALSANETISIVWLSYNVHGNESAGTEAAMLTAYELVTSKQDLLKNTVVILDPCINPDGRDRYVNWYNENKGQITDLNVESSEHQEGWPSGRPNHYMFDLNRDWAWVTQKESQQRIALYNLWLPHVHVDFHEQGMNEPYYFAPAAEPYHEVITPWQREFQNGIGKNNAKYFDKNGWFYFTKEIFDLLYPSYGDTYPTYSGAIGMTYEQGGSGRGGLAVINSENDTLTLTDRAFHHHIAGLSTVEYASLHTSDLIREFQSFSKNKNYKYKSYVVGGNTDNLNALRKLLDAHQIQYGFGTNATAKGFLYSQNGSGTLKATDKHLVISTNQVKGTLVNVLFEPKTKLVDSLTYDITAWNLPYAYGLEALASETIVNSKNSETERPKNELNKDAYAYIADWNSMQDARFLSALLKSNIKVRYSENPFTINGKNWERGTLIIAKGDNQVGFDAKVIQIANELGIQLSSTTTGMAEKGNDFGSSSVKLISKVKVAVIFDNEASSLNAGEIWHYFDNNLDYPISRLKQENLTRSTLNEYDVLIVPEGWYSDLNGDAAQQSIKEWIHNGGKIIAIGSAAAIFAGKEGYQLKPKSSEKSKEKDDSVDPSRHEHAHIQYSAREREMIKNTITGAIFKCKVEQTNPLAFGYGDSYYSLKLSSDAYEWLENGSNVVYLEDNAKPLNGFAGSQALPNQSKSLVFGQENMGDGCLIYMIDNPLFRGFWENGKLFFANALFFANN